jgi:hypothetical protein
MASLLIEFNYSGGQVERWRIKVKKCSNIPVDEIVPKLSRRNGALRYLLVGREVANTEIKRYFKGYLSERGLWENVLRMKLIM